MILYQLYPLLGLELADYKCWYPMSYVYHRQKQNIWQKLSSREYCEKIKVLFGVSTTEELREKVSKSFVENNIGYGGCFESPLSILSNIKLEDIGTMN